jgi:protein SCO1/2
VVQLGGMATMVSLGSFMFVMFRRDYRLSRKHDLTNWKSDGRSEKDEG